MTNRNPVNLKSVEQKHRIQYLKYLLSADESEAAVSMYIDDGEMYSIHYQNELIGAALLIFHPRQAVEIKNFALDPAYRGKGLGKLAIMRVCQLYRKKGIKKVLVGTANSSIGNLAFYQKAGFRIVGIKRDFFKSYPEPIIENGIRALDMVMFEMNIDEQDFLNQKSNGAIQERKNLSP